MRVIAGTAKGIRLGRVPPGVRPVSDRAREGLFSSLGDLVREARVLDLFAGTGAMGIEALSRGALECTFVDRSATAVHAISENLERTGLGDRARVVREDVSRFVIETSNPERLGLVLIDPPWELEGPALDRILAALGSRWLAGTQARVVLTRSRRSSTPVIPVDWALARRLRYGDGLALVYRPGDRPVGDREV